MKKLKLFALAAMTLIGFSGIAIAADATMLSQDDFVGISFMHLLIHHKYEQVAEESS